VILTQEMVKVVDEAYNTVAAHLRQVRALYNQGMVSSLVVTQVEAMLAEWEPKKVQAKNAVIMARISLNNYLNIDLETVVEAAGELKYEKHELPLAEDLYAIALEHRPEARIMRIRREMARRMYEMALANAYPSVVLFVNYQWNKGQEMPPNDQVWRDGYQAGVAVQIPIYDGRETEGKVAEAEAMMRQVDEGSRLLELGIKTQIQQALQGLRAAEEQIAAEEMNLKAAAKNHQVTVARYNAGLASNIEVKDAHNQLTAARAMKLQAIYEYNMAWVQLQAALGMPEEELLK
jgi:outer membrane protein